MAKLIFGNRWQYVSLFFEVAHVSGELGLSDETTQVGYFTVDEIAQMDLMESHRVRIKDAIADQIAAFVR